MAIDSAVTALAFIALGILIAIEVGLVIGLVGALIELFVEWHRAKRRDSNVE